MRRQCRWFILDLRWLNPPSTTARPIARPDHHDVVRSILRDTRRNSGVAQPQKTAIETEALRAVVLAIPVDLRGLRDRAWLQLRKTKQPSSYLPSAKLCCLIALGERDNSSENSTTVVFDQSGRFVIITEAGQQRSYPS
jgi:hypothetical protein